MRTKQILVIDDDPDVRLALNVRLRANGWMTRFATDAVMAVSEALKSLPDLIILDLGLPAGDGYVVMRRLRIHPNLACIPIIVVSARDAKANRDRALLAGAHCYLQKPVNNDELLREIRGLIGDPAANISADGGSL